jgi:Na+/H+-dicarboxylate symporter
MIAAIVDWNALGKVVWVSLVAGIGVSAAFSVVVFGLARAGDARRAGRLGATVPYYALAAVGVLACGLALWRGYVFVAQKS